MLKPLLTRIAALAARPIYGGIGSIHVMHRIVPKSSGPRIENQALELTPGDLDAILRWMKARSYDFIPIDEVPARLAAPSPRKFICFTLDDGYRDNLENALPIFEKHSVPFTINITTALSSHTMFAWWYALEDLLLARDHLTFRHGDRAHDFRLGAMPEKLAGFDSIARLIRDCDLDQHAQILASIFESAPFDPYQKHARDLILGWDDVIKLDAHPLVTIGSHGMNHLTCSRLGDNTVRAELAGSRRILEHHLGHPVRHLAYPFGGRNAAGARDFQCAHDCGYVTAVTTRGANLFPDHAAALDRLPRLCVSGNYSAISRLDALDSGLVPARDNHWQRVVTA